MVGLEMGWDRVGVGDGMWLDWGLVWNGLVKGGVMRTCDYR